MYALIYGSPVPGYAAPEDAIDPAARIGRALLTVICEGHRPQREPPRNRWGHAQGEPGILRPHSFRRSHSQRKSHPRPGLRINLRRHAPDHVEDQTDDDTISGDGGRRLTRSRLHSFLKPILDVL